MLEHVPDPASIIHACEKTLKPGGLFFLSTINRTLKAYMFAIFGAEYVFKLLPKKTHDYDKFIRPSELDSIFRENQLKLEDMKGMSYNPLSRRAEITNDVSVNYLMVVKKPAS